VTTYAPRPAVLGCIARPSPPYSAGTRAGYALRLLVRPIRTPRAWAKAVRDWAAPGPRPGDCLLALRLGAISRDLPRI
jgi:hypothetical protein